MQMGDLGLLNLKAYHMAVTLDQIKYGWHSFPDKQWVLMEGNLANITDDKAALLEPIKDMPRSQLLSPSITFTIHCWKSLLTGKPSRSGTSQLSIPFDLASRYIPDISLNSWIDKGITTLDVLFDGCLLKSFVE